MNEKLLWEALTHGSYIREIQHIQYHNNIASLF